MPFIKCFLKFFGFVSFAGVFVITVAFAEPRTEPKTKFPKAVLCFSITNAMEMAAAYAKGGDADKELIWLAVTQKICFPPPIAFSVEGTLAQYGAFYVYYVQTAQETGVFAYVVMG